MTGVKPIQRRTRLACLLTIALASPSIHCQDRAAPFVAGFDRFVRHSQVEQELGGGLLLSELSCTACHQSNNDLLRPKLGPKLTGAGDRLRPAWLRRFLADPQTVKPGTTMPDALAGMSDVENQYAIEALVAFLSTQHEPFPVFKASGANPVPHEFWNKGDPTRGQQLFHQVGCVACHEPDDKYEVGQTYASPIDQLLAGLDPDEIEEMGLAAFARPVRSIPHANLSAKYTSKSLTYFLLNPERVRPDGRMPSLKLKLVEAADIAAHLLRKQDALDEANSESADESLIQEGQRLFNELRCANCHTAKSSKPPQLAKRLDQLKWDATKTCFGDAHRELPHFRLDQIQTRAVCATIRDLQAADEPVKVSANSQVQFRMLQMNCYACHQRGELGGVGRHRRKYFETVGHVDLGDEGRFPPPLSGVGGKLQQPWLNKVLGGTGDVRPHMLARMPKYSGKAVASVSALFTMADASPQQSEKQVFGELGGLAASGRLLLDVGCVQCHPARGESLPGVAGVDLAGVTTRVQPHWFREFLLNPEQLKRGTRMPTFFPNGKSSNPKVLEASVDKQIAAMWSYLKEIDKHPLPQKLVDARSRNFELIPSDRPILLRTFMEQAGTHAIAVGYPQKVHFAFDSENVRLVQAWRGRFLDAYGTWFERFAPPAEPLGNDLIAMPVGVSLARLRDKQQRWPTSKAEDIGYRFLGYRMDPSGVPTFLYRVGRYEVEDLIKPNASNGFSRCLRIVDLGADDKTDGTLWFRANVGKTLKQEKTNSYANDLGLTSTVSENVARLGVVRRLEEQSEWIIPITVKGEATIEVEYQW